MLEQHLTSQISQATTSAHVGPIHTIKHALPNFHACTTKIMVDSVELDAIM
jgi:hypothetical protein